MRKALRLFAVLVLLLSFAAGAEVIPDYYSAPGLDPNRDYLNQHFTEHIDPFSGKLQMHHIDLALPGNGGFDLQFQRSYSSVESALGPHTPWGVGWTMHFGRIIKQKDYYVCSRVYLASLTDNPVLELPDGSRQILFDAWGLNGSGPQYISANRWKADCATNGGLIVTSPTGVQYDMTVMETKTIGATTEYSWYVSRITDRNGNTMNFTYSLNASGYILLKSISTSDGRNVSFAYADESTGDACLSSISSAGQTWSYSYVRVPGYANLWFLTQVTRPDGAAWKYDYYGNLGTSAGSFAMKQATYPTGGTLNYSYGFVQFDTTNPFNYVTVVKTKSGDGGSWSFNYVPGSSYDLTTITAPNGTTTYKHIGYSAATNGGVWKIGLLLEKKVGNVQTETYSWDGQLISNEPYYRPGAFSQKTDVGTRAPIMTGKVIARDGGTYSTTYSSFDAYGNPQSISENGDASRSRSVTYYINTSKWIVNQLKDETISGVGTITRTFDGSGNMTSENRFGVTTNYGYTSAGDVSSITNPRGFSTTLGNYKRGVPQSEQRPASVSISRIVSDAGNITSETDGEGQATGYSYDALNRLTSINRPTGNDVSISWSANSRSVVRGGFSEATSFDGFGRATSVNAGGISRTMNYNSVGQKTFESYPSSSSGTSFSYDILNRVKTMTNADGSSKSFSYGSSNVSVTNERGNTTSFSYRAYGDPDKKALTAINAPLSSASISMSRNGMDQITQVTQGGVTRTYGYDSRFFLTSASNPETGTTSYGRDAVGNMTSKQVSGASAIGYSYDGLNRVTGTSYASAPSVTFSYNRNSKLTSVNSSAAQRTYQYDANSNMTSETLAVDGYSFTTSYGYNGNDNLSSITYPRSGKTVSYSPNVLGRPTAASPYVTLASYWPSGQLQRISHSDGTIDDFGQNTRLWPSSVYSRKSTAFVNSSYNYDGAGNVTGITDSVDSSFNRTLAYDAIDRLIKADGPWGSGTSINYDGMGNIVNQTLGTYTLTYGYDGQKRLSSVSGSKTYSFSYDANGNVTGNGANAFSYDDASNMRCVNCATNPIQYVYDGNNMRVSSMKNGVKTYEIYGHDGNLLSEYTPSAGLLVEHIYLAGKRVASRRQDSSTLTGLSVTPNPSAVGQPVILTAAITGVNPTGSVTFKDGSTVLGTSNVSAGIASLSVSSLALGSHSLTAVYSGDTNNLASASAAVSQTVKTTATTTATLFVAPNPSEITQSVTLSANVTGFNPTGNVNFQENGSTFATVGLNSGNAILVLNSLSLGNHAFSVAYAGDAKNDPSASSAVTQVVTLVSSQTTMTFSSNPSNDGKPVVITVTVAGRSPTGSIVFTDGSTTLGTIPLVNGIASITVNNFTYGSHVIKASYAGDNNHLPSSVTVVLSMSKVGTQTTVTPSFASAVKGTPVTFSIKVTGTGTIPSGTVTLMDGNTVLTTLTLANGTASFTTTLPLGGHSISAVYNGDSIDVASASIPILVTLYDPVSVITIINSILLNN